MADGSSGRDSLPVDLHVGLRIRLRREFLGISQERLGASIGVSFQQVQKYERGQNRISASKLHAIAAMLRSPVAYFFEGLKDAGAEDSPGGLDEMMITFLNSPDGIDLAAAFNRIASAPARRQLVRLTQAIADQEEARGLLQQRCGD